MVNDERCLTDMFVRELQPQLTPALTQAQFQEVSLEGLNLYEQRRIQEIDQGLVSPGRDFRDPQDRLIYAKERTLMQLRAYRRTSSTLYDTAHPFGMLFRFDLEDHPEMQRDHAARLIPTDDGLQAIAAALTEQLHRQIWISRADSTPSAIDGVATTFWQRFEPEELPLEPKPNQLYFTLWFQADRQPRGYVEGEVKQRAVTDTSRAVAFITNFTTLYMKRELQVYDDMRKADRAFAAGMSLSLGQ